jgi:hypothetical protein
MDRISASTFRRTCRTHLTTRIVLNTAGARGFVPVSKRAAVKPPTTSHLSVSRKNVVSADTPEGHGKNLWGCGPQRTGRHMRAPDSIPEATGSLRPHGPSSDRRGRPPGPRRHKGQHYCLTAIAEISIFAPPIKPATCTVARAGLGSGMSFL